MNICAMLIYLAKISRGVKAGAGAISQARWAGAGTCLLHGKEQRGAGVRGQTPASAAGASDVNLGDGEGNIDSRMVLSALNDRPYVCKIV